MKDEVWKSEMAALDHWLNFRPGFSERNAHMNQEEVFQKMKDTLEALRALKPEDRSEKARRIQITITEYEKMIAYYKTFVLGGE